MDDVAIPLWVDLVAIAIGAGTGAMVAEQFRDRKLDWLGVAIIGIATGLGGGVMRDLLLGVQPIAMQNDWYLPTAIAASIAGMFLLRALRRIDPVITVLDAAALGFFCAVGALKAAQFGAPPLPLVLCAVITAAGGGVLRDMLLGMPVGIMFTGSLYAAAAVTGGGAMLLSQALGLDAWIGFAACAVVTFVVRMLSVRFGLTLPEQMQLGDLRKARRRSRTMRDRMREGEGRRDGDVRGGARSSRGNAVSAEARDVAAGVGGPVTDEEFVEAASLHSPSTRPIEIIGLRRAQERDEHRPGHA